MTSPSLATLLTKWETFASHLADGYELGLDDYLDDLDARRLIDETLASGGLPADLQQRLGTADKSVQERTERARTCLWGQANADELGWTAETQWWYWALPKRRSDEFERDYQRL